MITEERIRELWAKYYVVYISERELRFALDVAAEARKEGMEEGYRAGFMHAAAEPDRHLENSLYEWLREQRK